MKRFQSVDLILFVWSWIILQNQFLAKHNEREPLDFGIDTVDKGGELKKFATVERILLKKVSSTSDTFL